MEHRAVSYTLQYMLAFFPLPAKRGLKKGEKAVITARLPYLCTAAGSMKPLRGSMRAHSNEMRKEVEPMSAASLMSSRNLRSKGNC